MAQQSPPPVKKGVVVLQWFGVLLFLCSFSLGIFGIVARVDLIPTVIAFILALFGVPLSILQIDKNAFSFVLRNKDIGMQLFGTVLIIFSIALGIYNYIYLRSTPVPGGGSVTRTSTATTIPTSTSIPTQVPITPTGTVPPPSFSALRNQRPIINDSLSSQDDLQWDMYPLDQNGACTFKDGAYHAISTSGNSNSCLATQAKPQNVTALQADMNIFHGDIGGIIFRSNTKEDSFYAFTITTNGSYSLIKSYLSNNIQTYDSLANGTSQQIKQSTNQLNTLTVIIYGSTFFLYINTQYVGDASDASYTSGLVGVFTNTDSRITADAAFPGMGETLTDLWYRHAARADKP